MKAIILAGGRGERLMPLTSDRPKCLLEVGGRPILAHQLAWLAGQKVDQVVISCGYCWEAIRDFIGDGRAFGPLVTYAVEDRPLGRGGGLRKALAQLLPLREPVVAVNGDVLTVASLGSLRTRHKQANALATLLLVPYVSQYGVVELDSADRIVSFQEKPALPYWLSGGVYLLSPDVYPLLPRRGDHETTTWPRLALAGKLQGYRYTGRWQSIDSAKDLAEAERRWGRRF